MLAKEGDDGISIEKENIVGSVIQDDVLWSCTTCKACDEICPVNIEILDKILDMRRYLSLMESDFPTELGKAFVARDRLTEAMVGRMMKRTTRN